MSKKSKSTKKAKHFLHYYQNDFHRTVVVLVGDVDSAEYEIRKAWKDQDHANDMIKGFKRLAKDFDYESLVANKSGRADEVRGGGTFLAWFPVIPEDHTLLHELLHCVQYMRDDLHIDDWEYEAYMLETLFEHFQTKLHEDSKVPFDVPANAIIED